MFSLIFGYIFFILQQSHYSIFWKIVWENIKNEQKIFSFSPFSEYIKTIPVPIFIVITNDLLGALLN